MYFHHIIENPPKKLQILSVTRTILALTWFYHVSMYLWSLGGAWGAPRGDPPLYMKKLQCLKMVCRPFGAKKIKKIGYGKWPSLTPPSLEFSIMDFFLTLPLVNFMKELLFFLTGLLKSVIHQSWQHQQLGNILEPWHICNLLTHR